MPRGQGPLFPEPPVQHPGRWVSTLLSYFKLQELETRTTEHNPLLRVVECNGRRRLDGLTVNYSRGALGEVLAESFDRLELGMRRIDDVLLLGFGAGSAVEILRGEHGHDPRFTAVEIDPVVIELARRWFGYDGDPRVLFVCDDAREFVLRTSRATETRFDLVLVDAFVDDAVSPSVQDADFARGLYACVRSGGALVFNTLLDSFTRRAESHRIETMLRAELGAVERLDVRTNRLLVWNSPRSCEHD